jgi:hypothetical protein
VGDGELGDVLTSVDLIAAVGDTSLIVNGLTYAREHLWVSGRLGFDQRRLFKVDLDGNLVEAIPIGGLSSLGWRSIASDGDHIFGVDTYSIAVLSIDTGQIVDNVVTGSISADGLAYDPDNGHFYLGSGNGSIKVLDRDGDEVRLVVTPYEIDGLAWDDRSPGGPFLWAWVELDEDTVGPRCEAVQLDPFTGLATGVVFRGEDLGALPSVPEAAVITRDAIPGKLTLLALQEDDAYPGDEAFVVGYDLDVVLPPSWIELTGATVGSVQPEGTSTLQIAIHGAMADTTTAAVLKIASNDLDQPLVEVPVTVAMLRRLIPTAVAGGAVPGLLVLEQNYPNPFNPITRIAFALREPAEVALEIVDLRGRRVMTSRQEYPAGRHEFVWHGTDQAGRAVSSGVYLYTVRAGDATSTRKMLMTR